MIAAQHRQAPHDGAGAADRIASTNAAAELFFAASADAIAVACRAMAERFEKGGRLFVCGTGAQRSDVAHVVVEFVHPVIVGKRALPTIALPDVAAGAAEAALATLSRRGDLLMLISTAPPSTDAERVLAAASERGILTIALTGAVEGAFPQSDHLFMVGSADACIVQETHEMLYHILWELVHVFFDHGPVHA